MPSKQSSCAFTLRGSLNGEFLSASGRIEGIDGVAEVSAVVAEQKQLTHSTWIWGSFTRGALGFIPEGKLRNPCELYPHRMTRQWKGEDGASISSKHNVSVVNGSLISEIHCLGETFDSQGPVMTRKIVGQFPSHWVTTAKSDKEIDVYGIITYQLDGGSTYVVHIHDLIIFDDPCILVGLTRLYWKLEVADGEYHPDHWWHKEIAVIDPCWNFGPSKDKMSFTWSLHGSINEKSLEINGVGFGSGFRQHQWAKGAKGFIGADFPNLAWPLAWEGHAGLHFFTRFPRGVVNPFILALPEGFVVTRNWFGHDGAHWTSNHDVRFADGIISKKVALMGADFPVNSIMMMPSTDSKPDDRIVRSFPQYIVAVPKGDDHIWYRSCFQYQLGSGKFYSGYWEMDVHCRKKIQMPSPFVVRVNEETWDCDGTGWSFYLREEVEPSTYDSAPEREKRSRASTSAIHPPSPMPSDSSSAAAAATSSSSSSKTTQILSKREKSAKEGRSEEKNEKRKSREIEKAKDVENIKEEQESAKAEVRLHANESVEHSPTQFVNSNDGISNVIQETRLESSIAEATRSDTVIRCAEIKSATVEVTTGTTTTTVGEVAVVEISGTADDAAVKVTMAAVDETAAVLEIKTEVTKEVEVKPEEVFGSDSATGSVTAGVMEAATPKGAAQVIDNAVPDTVKSAAHLTMNKAKKNTAETKVGLSVEAVAEATGEAIAAAKAESGAETVASEGIGTARDELKATRHDISAMFGQVTECNEAKSKVTTEDMSRATVSTYVASSAVEVVEKIPGAPMEAVSVPGPEAAAAIIEVDNAKIESIVNVAALSVEVVAGGPVEEVAAAPLEEKAATLTEEVAAAPTEEVATASAEKVVAASTEELAAASAEKVEAAPTEEVAALPVDKVAGASAEKVTAASLEMSTEVAEVTNATVEKVKDSEKIVDVLALENSTREAEADAAAVKMVIEQALTNEQIEVTEATTEVDLSKLHVVNSDITVEKALDTESVASIEQTLPVSPNSTEAAKERGVNGEIQVSKDVILETQAVQPSKTSVVSASWSSADTTEMAWAKVRSERAVSDVSSASQVILVAADNQISQVSTASEAIRVTADSQLSMLAAVSEVDQGTADSQLSMPVTVSEVGGLSEGTSTTESLQISAAKSQMAPADKKFTAPSTEKAAALTKALSASMLSEAKTREEKSVSPKPPSKVEVEELKAKLSNADLVEVAPMKAQSTEAERALEETTGARSIDPRPKGARRRSIDKVELPKDSTRLSQREGSIDTGDNSPTPQMNKAAAASATAARLEIIAAAESEHSETTHIKEETQKTSNDVLTTRVEATPAVAQPLPEFKPTRSILSRGWPPKIRDDSVTKTVAKQELAAADEMGKADEIAKPAATDGHTSAKVTSSDLAFKTISEQANFQESVTVEKSISGDTEASTKGSGRDLSAVSGKAKVWTPKSKSTKATATKSIDPANPELILLASVEPPAEDAQTNTAAAAAASETTSAAKPASLTLSPRLLGGPNNMAISPTFIKATSYTFNAFDSSSESSAMKRATSFTKLPPADVATVQQSAVAAEAVEEVKMEEEKSTEEPAPKKKLTWSEKMQLKKQREAQKQQTATISEEAAVAAVAIETKEVVGEASNGNVEVKAGPKTIRGKSASAKQELKADFVETASAEMAETGQTAQVKTEIKSGRKTRWGKSTSTKQESTLTSVQDASVSVQVSGLTTGVGGVALSPEDTRTATTTAQTASESQTKSAKTESVTSRKVQASKTKSSFQTQSTLQTSVMMYQESTLAPPQPTPAPLESSPAPSDSSTASSQPSSLKPILKFKPRVFVVPPSEPPPPLLKAPKISLKEALPVERKQMEELSAPLEEDLVEASSIIVERPGLKLEMVDPANLLHLQANGGVEVDYTNVTSAARICLSPVPEPAKTVKWKSTNLVTVSHIGPS